jgi:DNA repair photolyase
MGRLQCIEITSKTALNRVQGMPFRWSLNPYVGCAHACQYCYARAYYARAEHGDPGREFAARILVKVNLPAVLRAELGRPGWRHEPVALGTATDCYQPIEGRYRLTRALLAVLLERQNPASLVTKAPLVCRDLDLWSALARVARVRIYVTITTLDAGLWRQLEPGTPSPTRRLAAVARLNAAGVPAGVLAAPVIPGLTDSEAALDALAAAAAAHGATCFGAGALRLAPTVKEHFFDFLAEKYPDLLQRYQRAYPGVNAPRDYLQRLEARLTRVRERHGFARDAMRPGLYDPPAPALTAAAAGAGPQLALPI